MALGLLGFKWARCAGTIRHNLALKKEKKETINNNDTRCHPEAYPLPGNKQNDFSNDRSRDQSFRPEVTSRVFRRWPRGGGGKRIAGVTHWGREGKGSRGKACVWRVSRAHVRADYNASFILALSPPSLDKLSTKFVAPGVASIFFPSTFRAIVTSDRPPGNDW